jgi:hypothetical protein
MTRNELMERLESYNEMGDLFINEIGERISVDIYDFVGFDENWEEVDREVGIDVEEFIEFLQNNANSYEMGFYSTFEFADCVVRLGYTSYDI